ncbi:hypothetical protein Tsubulata_018543 [Turnera subulata]|uniref:Uncharacterized protein n=1 Tax=Turnera subulata TaxID=218843 RepID=A0A9Q0GDC1_9ROSI|nr:hypothetical protein Tsubulata_018543 [Turnera subulata]
MENSTEEERRSREENCCIYSPCYLCERVVRLFFKCLGYDDDSPTGEPDMHHHHHHPSEAETAMKINEEVSVLSTRSIRVARRRPRPPVSSGGGGQIN